MAVPDFQSLFAPILRSTLDGDRSTVEMRDCIASELQLTPKDLDEKLPSGRQTVFANRVAWAVVYLSKANALERIKRGVFRITERGRELLNSNGDSLRVQALSQYPEFVAFHRGPSNEAADVHQAATKPQTLETPEERLANAYRVLREALANDVLEAAKRASPAFFEELVVDLLVAMGYGGSVEDAGRAVGKSGDGGIDGIIKEDKLGLDVVYVQAKRWSGGVGRPQIQAFAGSLEGVRARKGVFITTSYFSVDAIEYVQRIEKRIVLIDGKQLAELMIEHDIGVTTSQTYKVKRVDSDYFEET